MTKYLLAVILMLIAAPDLPAADEIPDGIRAEITESVIEPCFLTIARKGGMLEQYSEEDALALMRAGMQKQMEKTTAGIYKSVGNLETYDERRVFYGVFLKRCIRGN